MLERIRVKSLPGPQQAVFDQSQSSHEGSHPDGLVSPDEIWPVYYPPEAYPSLLGTEQPQREHTFREQTPQMPDSPVVPPFQFSSSSLSAALSDPPRTSLPLPPVPEDETFDSEPGALASTAYSPAHHGAPYEPDTVSPADLSLHHNQIESIAKAVSRHISDFPSPAASSSSSPLWRSPAVFSSTDSLPLPPESRPPGRTFDHAPLDPSFGQYSSSSSSSPFAPPSSLSPADSPIPRSPVELPAIEHFSSSESLLFSPGPYYYCVAPSKREKKVRPRKAPKAFGEARLSSLLPLSE
jgi:hypothetical protein